MNISSRREFSAQSRRRVQTPKTSESKDSGGVSLQGYDQPPLSDLFDGSKPKFSDIYNKYISSTQVPHHEDANSYYNAEADAAIVKEMYAGIENLSGEARINALRDLVTDEHTPHPKGYHYVIAENLYTEVDRRPDGTVRSIYNAEPVKHLDYPDISLDTLEDNELSAIAGASGSAPEVIGAWLGFQNGRAELNCEHVVPQSTFNKAEPMRSDLHHLYACKIKDNSRRGSTRFGKFKPKGGRGEAARATLYFMLRYPKIRLGYNKKGIEMLKQWSEQDPVSVHERHRNHEIQKIQGNRNPFIDHPEWLKDFNP